jgi:hypothetical protein
VLCKPILAIWHGTMKNILQRSITAIIIGNQQCIAVNTYISDQMPPGVHSGYLSPVPPRFERAQVKHRPRHVQLRQVVRVQLAAGYSESLVDAVAAAVSPNGIPLHRVGCGCNNRAPLLRVLLLPVQWDRVCEEVAVVRGQVDVVHPAQRERRYNDMQMSSAEVG